MASSIYYVDGGDAEHALYIHGVSENIFALRGTEMGWGGPPRTNIIEMTPNQYSNQYRATVYDSRIYSVEFRLIESPDVPLEKLVRDWDAWHNAELGEGYVKRINTEDVVRCLDCVPQLPAFSSLEGRSRRVVQAYDAANPWWRDEDESSASGNFNGAAPVNVSCNNAGKILVWPVITITGIVNTPKFETADGYYTEVVKTTANADDEIIIDCRPNGATRRTIKFYEHGAGAGVFCSMSSSSRYIALPVGLSNVILTCAAGTCGVVIAWYNAYGSLF